jgi:hypothetical protein
VVADPVAVPDPPRTTEDQWRTSFEVNVLAAARLVKTPVVLLAYAGELSR